ncbi:MAG: NAD-binding protein [Thermoprotei archaeon]
MKIIIAGGGDTGAELAEALIREKHEVVVIEADEKRAQELADKLDCIVINGNAAHPKVLEEAGIREADVLFALTGNDRDNVIIALIARSAGVKRVIVKIEDPTYNDLLINMGITDIINPTRLTVVQALSILYGFDIINVSTIFRGNIRLVVVSVPAKLAGKKYSELDIDRDKARLLILYRGGEAHFPREDLVLEKGDLLLIATRADYRDKVLDLFKRED